MTGDRIILRPIQKDDIDILNIWKNDEEVYRYLGGGYQPISKNQQEKWMEELIDMTGNSRRFMIEDHERKSVGMIGLYDINWIHRTCEIGAFIGEACAKKKGYASEACYLIEDYAINYLNLRKIKLNVVSENVLALKLWKKLGYVEVGELRDERYIGGKYCGVKIMEKFLFAAENEQK